MGGGKSVIFYHPEAYSTNNEKLMGRNAAGESFLRGYFKHLQTEDFWVCVTQEEHGSFFAQNAREVNRFEPIKIFTTKNLSPLREKILYYPGPDISMQAFYRTFCDERGWSICGITHTTSSASAMDAICSLVGAPIYPWDAVICTSTAVKKNVEFILQAQIESLKNRFGIDKIILPQLPLIPLGINCEDFEFTQNQKAQARKEIGVNKDCVVILFMGRLSFHGKAHPLAMYQALGVCRTPITQQ